MGVRAVGEIFLIKSGAPAVRGGGAGGSEGLESVVDMVLGRLGRGKVGCEGGWCGERDWGAGVLGMLVGRFW